MALIFGLVACGSSPDRVIVGAGTTLVDTGFMEAVAGQYEATHPGVQLSILGDSSAQILNLGKSGAAEVLITHAPEQEAVFLADEHPRISKVVFSSEFVLVGPPLLAETLNGLTTTEAFAQIADRGFGFVSRGDGSGTHETELTQWPRPGEAPEGDWYISTGQGMGLTLQVADQRGAFTLSEVGAFLGAENLGHLVRVDLVDPPTNPYRVTVIESASPAGLDFAEWLLGSDGQAAVRRVNEELFGAVVYQPVVRG